MYSLTFPLMIRGNSRSGKKPSFWPTREISMVSVVAKDFARCVGPTMWILELSMSQRSGSTLPSYVSLLERSWDIWSSLRWPGQRILVSSCYAYLVCNLDPDWALHVCVLSLENESVTRTTHIINQSFTEWDRTVHASKYTCQLVLGGALMMLEQEINY